ncbi:hypothetical protein I0P70_01840 [Pontibacter sp. FD36]|uniref:hypothetical protein n=1 Tax=Pontibacter sp. FD36 TaxID=2789860 RepID=UPI0018A9EDC9|nr:hypothetical protein [Pontibacter sp. FD36]MBF8961973.1 hypothetical protein [Pontibacter sp. FD36]
MASLRFFLLAAIFSLASGTNKTNRSRQHQANPILKNWLYLLRYQKTLLYLHNPMIVEGMALTAPYMHDCRFSSLQEDSPTVQV